MDDIAALISTNIPNQQALALIVVGILFIGIVSLVGLMATSEWEYGEDD